LRQPLSVRLALLVSLSAESVKSNCKLQKTINFAQLCCSAKSFLGVFSYACVNLYQYALLCSFLFPLKV
ncbi:MAG: hypothetical protein ACOX7J_01260, partial [Bacillota bacterium]